MGVGASKLNPTTEELPARLRPITRKIEEVKRRRRRSRRHSIVSTTELLRPEDIEDVDEDASAMEGDEPLALGKVEEEEEEAGDDEKEEEEGIKEHKKTIYENKVQSAMTMMKKNEDEVVMSKCSVKIEKDIEKEQELEKKEMETKAMDAKEKNDATTTKEVVKLIMVVDEKEEEVEAMVEKEKMIEMVNEDERKEVTKVETTNSSLIDVEMEKKISNPEHKEEKEEDEKKLRSNDMFGSPSFRFYCSPTTQDSDDDSIKFEQVKKKEELPQIKEAEIGPEPVNSNQSLTSSEDFEIKPQKKAKGGRLKGLIKAHTAVYHLLGCYKSPPLATQREGSRLITNKAPEYM